VHGGVIEGRLWYEGTGSQHTQAIHINIDRQFIEAWQTSSSLPEVAAKVRRNKNACRVSGPTAIGSVACL
jgi:hypothetical protein